ncbi:proline--tRNA ligase [candidate division WWE3 bacterium]|nr:proline--tRNA ligase [candidate division WWE3 bacterium]
MYYSKMLGKTRRDAPKDAETISHKLLTRGGFIDQLISGVYTYLPLGWRVHQKIAQIIREELNLLGLQEINMPTLQNKDQWLETGRWDTIDPPLFKLKDRHGRETALGPTHEEVVTDLARRFVLSYKDLPFGVYQIQNKFRNEMRATGGLLRTREFVMKDLYSFHANEEDLDRFYLQVIETYKKIFKRVGLDVKVLYADPGTIGGTGSHEFGFAASSGEDTMFYCDHCDWAANIEKLTEDEAKSHRQGKAGCPECGQAVLETKSIENGHVFKLMTKYSEAMKASFTDKDGIKKNLIMGCYGIGIGRLMATIVEVSRDDSGIIWPESVAPFQVHLLSFGQNAKSEEAYRQLLEKGVEVLFDDREDISAGEKLKDSDLIGIPTRIIVSEKSLNSASVEVSKRVGNEIKLLPLANLTVAGL